MLGKEFVAHLERNGSPVVGLSRDDLDVTDLRACREAVTPGSTVVNCAAWTAVDDAEQNEAHAFSANALGARNLAIACAEARSRLVQVSTDYVFAGDADRPYREDDPAMPHTAYGRTKLAGEWASVAAAPDSLIVRTAWLYGDGHCFPRTIARLLERSRSVEVVRDQQGQPTWTRDVATAVIDLVVGQAPGGVYHVTAAGMTTWYDFAQEVARAVGVSPGQVQPVTTDHHPRPAQRPAYSVLDCDKARQLGFRGIGPWEERWREAAAAVLPPHD